MFAAFLGPNLTRGKEGCTNVVCFCSVSHVPCQCFLVILPSTWTSVCTNEGFFFGESRLRMLLFGLLHVMAVLFLNTDRHKLGPFCLRATHVEMAWKESHWKGA